MKIVAIIHTNGPCYHRLVLPLSLMSGVEVVFVEMHLDLEMDSWMDDSVFEGCNIVMYNRALEPYVIKWVAENKKKHGFKIGVDVDDHWDLGEDHILYDKDREERFRLVQIGHLQYADFVTTTHERLAEEIYPFNKKVYMFPNAIPKTGQFNITREKSDLIRLFWQGSRTHKKDIGILTKPMQDIVPIRGKIKMIMGGVEVDEDGKPREIWNEMKSIFTAGHRLRSAYILGEHVENYYYMYEQADICLVPLVLNKFNRFKSNLKVLEAANMGLPVIASQVHPYLSMPVNYCNRGSDWVEHIKRLVASPQLCIDQGELLREWADQNFNFTTINQERKELLEYESSKPGNP